MKPAKGVHFSFNCAIEGFLWAVRTQRHMRCHCLVAVGVVLAGLIFRVTALEFILLVFAIVLVLFAELVNTACETLVDLASPDFHPLARRVKDVAAGAVLLVSVGAAIVGYLILSGYVFAPPGDQPASHLGGVAPGELAVFSLATVILLVVLLKAWAGRGTPLEGGMPSGHAAFAFSVATTVALAPVGSVVMLLTLSLAVMIAHSRIYMGIHSVQEVLAGAMLGAGVTWVLHLCFG
ncbi:MAG: diacylglycerol kinase [Syntrophotalea acetylenica]|nr:diacylglycerol kinase [Syntrophotalea acetylenica]